MYHGALRPLSLSMTRRVTPWLVPHHRTNLIKPFDVVPHQLVDAAKRLFTLLRSQKVQGAAVTGSPGAFPRSVAVERPPGD